MYVCMYVLVSIVMHEQSMNHIRPRCYAKSPTAEDGFWPIHIPHQLCWSNRETGGTHIYFL